MIVMRKERKKAGGLAGPYKVRRGSRASASFASSSSAVEPPYLNRELYPCRELATGFQPSIQTQTPDGGGVSSPRWLLLSQGQFALATPFAWAPCPPCGLLSWSPRYSFCPGSGLLSRSRRSCFRRIPAQSDLPLFTLPSFFSSARGPWALLSLGRLF